MSDTQRTVIKYTNQSAFDLVALHAFTQGVKCVDSFVCRYRGPKNTKCFVGALIPDSLYSPNMEGKGVTALIGTDPEIRELFSNVDLELLSSLQLLHDKNYYVWNSTNEMRYALAAIADHFHLDNSIVFKLSFLNR